MRTRYRYIGCRDIYTFVSDYNGDISAFNNYLDGVFQDIVISYCASWDWVDIIHIMDEWVLYVQGIKRNCNYNYNYNLVLLSCYCGMLFRYCLSETRTFDTELCIINTIGFGIL